MAHERFASVFPRAVFAAPTPEVTPKIGSTSSPVLSYASFATPTSDLGKLAEVSRAWSAAINWFTALLEGHGQSLDNHSQRAIEFLLARRDAVHDLQAWYLEQVAIVFRSTSQRYGAFKQICTTTKDSAAAYSLLISSMQAIATQVERCLAFIRAIDGIEEGSQTQTWFHQLAQHVRGSWNSSVYALRDKYLLEESLAKILCEAMAESSQRSCDPDCLRRQFCECTIDLGKMPITQLRLIGLGGDIAEAAFAEALKRFLDGPLTRKGCFRVDWQNQTSCVSRLQHWVRTQLAPMVEHVLNELAPILPSSDYQKHETLPELRELSPMADQALQELLPTFSRFDHLTMEILSRSAITGIARARAAHFFDHIKVWPQSEGAIEDIKALIVPDRPDHKSWLCEACKKQLSERLLHAGASTSEILATYVNLIYVFKKLDARGAMLEYVSPTIRRYLRSRHDAVNVIAESLLADPSDGDYQTRSANLCLAIANELQNAVHTQAQASRSLDWDDMQWVPEPIDAGPNYRNSKTNDVLSYILSLYDQDDFIKEIETVLAEHLLKTKDTEIVRETRLLEMLKTRLDAAKLQNLEVMLKDVRDSITFEKRMRPGVVPPAVPTPKEVQAAIPAHGIAVGELYARFDQRVIRTHFQAIVKLVAIKRNDLLFPKRVRLPLESAEATKPPEDESALKLRILSSSAWPQLRTSTFTVPPKLSKQLREAEDKFSSTSGQRRLKWRPALGTMSVTLDLEDRTVIERDLPAWRAVVIDAFAQSDSNGPEPTLRTVPELAAMLEMEEDLVHEALAFWLSKRVLYQHALGIYAVLERLDMESEMSLQGEVHEVQANAVSALKSQDAMLHENAAMFEAFIGNMLRNGGAKEVDGMMGITNMMKMVLPTFTYGDQEVLWLLDQMLARGEVVKKGDSWAVATTA